MKEYTIQQGVYVPEDVNETRQFEIDYIGARAMENRVYTDAEVAALPNVPRQHVHYKEWLIRGLSAQKLTGYLQAKNKPLAMLEIGSGNGWLSNKLAQIKGATVMGADINLAELQQAARVFKETPNLQFAYVDDYLQMPRNTGFDVIVFAASVQYFRSFNDIIAKCLQLLKPGGEIHIIDTNFYTIAQVTAAQQRTREYYASIGYPGMSNYYYHHSWDVLAGFNAVILYNPTGWLHKFSSKKRPFPWVSIKKAEMINNVPG